MAVLQVNLPVLIMCVSNNQRISKASFLWDIRLNDCIKSSKTLSWNKFQGGMGYCFAWMAWKCMLNEMHPSHLHRIWPTPEARAIGLTESMYSPGYRQRHACGVSKRNCRVIWGEGNIWKTRGPSWAIQCSHADAGDGCHESRMLRHRGGWSLSHVAHRYGGWLASEIDKLNYFNGMSFALGNLVFLHHRLRQFTTQSVSLAHVESQPWFQQAAIRKHEWSDLSPKALVQP